MYALALFMNETKSQDGHRSRCTAFHSRRSSSSIAGAKIQPLLPVVVDSLWIWEFILKIAILIMCKEFQVNSISLGRRWLPRRSMAADAHGAKINSIVTDIISSRKTHCSHS